MAIQLIVGLGNPGDKYANTRHNAGFWFVDALARREGATFKPVSRLSGELTEISVSGTRVRLLKPTTFMNRSGQSVGATAKYYRIGPPSILVVHDELDLAAGTVRLKEGGGHGGHNGLRDIVQHLGSNAFLRLRVGVGHPGRKEAVVGHVLHRAGKSEQDAIDESLERAIELLPSMVRGDLPSAMNVLNRREKSATRPKSEARAADSGEK